MKDYNFIDDKGNRVKVEDMSTEKIVDVLNDNDVDICSNDEGIEDPKKVVLERLRIELVRKELGL